MEDAEPGDEVTTHYSWAPTRSRDPGPPWNRHGFHLV